MLDSKDLDLLDNHDRRALVYFLTLVFSGAVITISAMTFFDSTESDIDKLICAWVGIAASILFIFSGYKFVTVLLAIKLLQKKSFATGYARTLPDFRKKIKKQKHRRKAYVKKARDHASVVLLCISIIAICSYFMMRSTNIWLQFTCYGIIVLAVFYLVPTAKKMILVLYSIRCLELNPPVNKAALRRGINELEQYANQGKDV